MTANSCRDVQFCIFYAFVQINYMHIFLGSVKHFQFAVKILHQSLTLFWTMVFRIKKCSSVITQVCIYVRA